MEIWDGHCHLAGVPGATPTECMGNMVALADRMGVAKMCVFMGMTFDYDPSPEKLREDNDQILEAVRAYPDRALGFVYLNPKHLEINFEELDRCVARGPMVAIKLWVAQNCDTPQVDAIVRRATELRAPIFQHTWDKITGNLPGESKAEDLARLAVRHPNTTFICGHTGGDWERGIRAIAPLENIYADIGGGDPTSGFTEMAVRELGARRVLFGSDIGGRSYGSQLAKVYGAQLTDEEKSLIFSGNMKRILAPIMASKDKA